MRILSQSKSRNVFSKIEIRKPGRLILFPVQVRIEAKSNFGECLKALKNICPDCKEKAVIS